MGKCAILAAISGMLLASVIAADAEGASFWYRHKVPGIVVVDSSGNTRPMIVGVPSGLTVEAGQTVRPFASVALTDPDEDDVLTVTVRIDDPAKGSFTALGGFEDRGRGSYRFEGDPDGATSALRAMVFAPAEGRLAEGESETVSFALSAQDAAGSAASAMVALLVTGIPAEAQPGGLWAWGPTNTYGQIGDGSTNGRSSPYQIDPSPDWVMAAVGNASSFGIKADGTLWVWGDNRKGQLGLGNTTERKIPTLVGSASGWKTVASGIDHSLAIKSDGTLWAWGDNYDSKLGLGNGVPSSPKLSPTRVGAASDWVAVGAGAYFSLALKSDGTLWAWGQGANGELGGGPTIRSKAPMQVGTDADWKAISVSRYHSLALKLDGTLWAWGYNLQGQLGLGDSGSGTNRSVPTRVGTDADWAMAYADHGGVGSFAVKADGTLWGWGRGHETPTRLGADKGWKTISGRLALKVDGTLWEWPNNPFDGTGPVRVGAASDWKAIAAGSHMLAIR